MHILYMNNGSSVTWSNGEWLVTRKQRKNRSKCHFDLYKPVWTHLGLNLGLQKEKPAPKISYTVHTHFCDHCVCVCVCVCVCMYIYIYMTILCVCVCVCVFKWVKLISELYDVYIPYRGADKSIAPPGRKQAKATEDFDFHISYL